MKRTCFEGVTVSDYKHPDWERLFANCDEGSEFSFTCLKERGHEGTHEWTPDSQVILTFASAPDEEQPHG